MTYKELVDRIEDAVVRHKMLTDFGCGQLSDIKVLDNSEDGADYPYAFLLPTGISRAQQAVTYSFSLIVMEMAITPREILKVQSDCIQYINDLVADLRFDTDFAGDINLTQAIQVFRERFQDEVAGATLNLQVTVADQIDNCNAPSQTILETLVGTPGTRDYNSPATGSRLIVPRWNIPEAPASYRFKGTIKFSINRALTDDAAPWNVPYISVLQDADDPRYLADIPFDGSASMIGVEQTVEVDYTFTLEDVAPDNNDLSITFGYNSNEATYPGSSVPIQEYDGAINLISANIEILK